MSGAAAGAPTLPPSEIARQAAAFGSYLTLERRRHPGEAVSVGRTFRFWCHSKYHGAAGRRAIAADVRTLLGCQRRGGR